MCETYKINTLLGCWAAYVSLLSKFRDILTDLSSWVTGKKLTKVVQIPRRVLSSTISRRKPGNHTQACSYTKYRYAVMWHTTALFRLAILRNSSYW